MGDLNRRDFMRWSAGAAAAAWSWSSAGFSAEAAPAAAMRKALGKTGLTPTLLGMGTGTRAGGKSSEQNRQGREVFVRTLLHAYERGLRYYDLADSYGAHDYLKEAMKQAQMPRGDLFLLTKTGSREAASVQSDLERFRKELDTDYLDVVLLHCLTDADWTVKMQPCMDVLSEAKAKGVIRAHGVSCHSLQALKLAAETPWVDVMLSRINPYGEKMDGTAKEVAPVLQKAHAAGKGVLGMKILGEGKLADKMDQSLDFVLNLGCIDAMTIGFIAPKEIDEVIARMDAAVSGVTTSVAAG
jgi:aryl-alcohol dehydrogenase-like predicted oxidoreductase